MTKTVRLPGAVAEEPAAEVAVEAAPAAAEPVAEVVAPTAPASEARGANRPYLTPEGWIVPKDFGAAVRGG